MLKKITVFLLFFFSLLPLSAQKEGSEYEKFRFTGSNGEKINYRLLKPEKPLKGKKYPLVLFLHGAGERGDDNEKQLLWGSGMWLNPVNREKYPCYVLFPQCPAEAFWAYNPPPAFKNPYMMPLNPEIPPVFQALTELLESYIKMPQIDEKRIYITGLSMGGMAAFDLLVRFPEKLAAVVPICGAVNPARLGKAKGVAIRIFHGDADDTVPVECSREAYKALKTAGANVEYHEYPSERHASWIPAFKEEDFMSWLFKQKR